MANLKQFKTLLVSKKLIILTSNFKKAIFITCSVLISGRTFAQGFHVQVRLKNPNHYKVNLLYPNEQKFVIDTGTRTEDGIINFTGKLSAPVIASLGVTNPEGNIHSKDGYTFLVPNLEFVLNNEDIIIDGNSGAIYSSKVSGRSNQAWSSIRPEETKLTRSWWEAKKSSYEKNTDSAKHNLEVVEANRDQSLKNLRTQNIRTHPDAFSSAYFLYSLWDQLDPVMLENLFSKLSLQLKQSIYGRGIDQKIQELKLTANGVTALPINKTDIAGNLVDLNNLRGNYILLDFWGSWCSPCRKSHPQLIELYNKYKSKGFVVVGIANESNGETLADNEKSWKDAIEEDKLPWIQILNNQDRQQNDIIKTYGVSAYPTKILIDKNGRIIARYIGSDEDNLEKKLREIFINQ